MPGPFNFAWAGGTIQEQQTLVTTGHTHGGIVGSHSIVGDIQAGSKLLINLGGGHQLETSTLYLIEGPGLPSATFFMIEDAISAGDGTLNLNVPATASLRGANFKVTESVEVDTGIAIFNANTNVVVLPTLDISGGGSAVYGGIFPPPDGYASNQIIFEDNFTRVFLNYEHWWPFIITEEPIGRWDNGGQLPFPFSGPDSPGGFQCQYYDDYNYGYDVNTTGPHLTGTNGLHLIAAPTNHFIGQGYEWASAAISSFERTEIPVEGGYVQFRAKMPDSRYGAWACLSFMSSDGPQIDLMESGYYLLSDGTLSPNNVMAMNFHDGSSPQIIIDSGHVLSDDYHTYGMEFRPGESIKMYLDGILRATYTDNIPTGALYQLVIDLKIANGTASGFRTVSDIANHPGPFQFDVADVQVYSLAIAPAAPGISAGYYGATSAAIGSAGGITIGSAYLFYDGGATGIMVAQQALSTVMGDSTFYSVVQTEVLALATGEFTLRLTAINPGDFGGGGDWSIVTQIPEAHLASLIPGLVYNIAGNGIANGTTFVAPSGGSTIQLSIPGTASTRAALLTITGPRTPNAPFDPLIHNRFDENILGIEIAQDEGGFATLTAQVKNPAVGLLAPGRNLWCWLSWDAAWTPAEDAEPDLLPLFNGRLVGVPKLQASEIVELEFIARPDDYVVQKMALTDALSVLPWHDPVWLAGNVNDDTVLETYSALWHIDRTTLALSISDIVQGEDGIIDISEGQALYDGFSLSYGQPPLNSVAVSGTVNWTQQADGLLDVTGPLVRAFSAAGSPLGNRPFASIPAVYNSRTGSGYRISGGGALISILNGDGLYTDWPKAGTSIGGGWSLSTENDAGGVPLCFIHDATYHKSAINFNLNYWSKTQPPQKGATDEETNVNAFKQASAIGLISVAFPVSNYKIRMMLQYRAERRRTETINAVLVGGVQTMVSDATDADRETVSLSSDYVSQGVDFGGEVPIGSLAYKSYFQTDRGSRSFEYLVLLARAKIRARARAVDLTFSTNWSDAIGLGIGLRNSVTLFDRRLPGGAATGKVKSYKLIVADGAMRAEFTIGCTIGTGLPSDAAIGVNSYVDDDYVEDGFQVVAGGQIELLPSEIAYQALTDFVVSDDGVNLSNITTENAVNSCYVTNGLDKQVETANRFQGVETDGQTPTDAMGELVTTVTLDMRPLTGSEFHTDFFPSVTYLALPKTIDLAALADLPMSLWDHPTVVTWDEGSSTWDEKHAQPN